MAVCSSICITLFSQTDLNWCFYTNILRCHGISLIAVGFAICITLVLHDTQLFRINAISKLNSDIHISLSDNTFSFPIFRDGNRPAVLWCTICVTELCMGVVVVLYYHWLQPRCYVKLHFCPLCLYCGRYTRWYRAVVPVNSYMKYKTRESCYGSWLKIFCYALIVLLFPSRSVSG